jgi:hypothetical protein
MDMVVSNTSKRRRRLAAALFLTTPLSTVSIVSPVMAQYSDEQAFTAYANSGFNYCDAKLVGMIWNKDVGAGKTILG